MSLLEYCLFHSSMGMVEAGSAPRGCLGAFSRGTSSSSSTGSSFLAGLGATSFLGVSFFGAASFLGAVISLCQEC